MTPAPEDTALPLPEDIAPPRRPVAPVPPGGRRCGRSRAGLLWLLLLCALCLWASPGALASASVTLAPASATLCHGQSQHFVASFSSSTYGYATYQWTVDNVNVQGNNQNPAEFDAPSNLTTGVAHTVKCTVTFQDSSGGGPIYVSKTANVTVVAPTLTVGPITASSNPASLCGGYYAPVAFNAAVAESCPQNPNGSGYYGYGLTYDWDFGDGSSHDTNPSPTHNYTQTGSFTVALTVTDSQNNLTRTVTMTEVVSAAGLSVDTATASPSQPTTCTLVQFNASASQGCGGGTPALTWAFGDGGTGSGASPTHQYAQAGTYTATATASDGQGHFASKSVTVTVTGGAVTVTSATSDAPTTATCSWIHFTGAATQACGSGALTYVWDFGDGSHAYVQNPAYAYPRPGTYTVILTVTAPGGGSATRTLTETITGSVGTIGVTAETADANPVCPGIYVQFSATAAEGCVTGFQYTWTFGDGGTGAGQYVAHQYASPGTYIVHVTATDPVSGASAARDLTETVKVPAVAISYATASPNPALLCTSIQFSAAASDDCVTALTYSWNFGDGSPVMVAAAGSHQYGVPGNYTAHLTVTNAFGSTAGRDVPVSVAAPAVHINSFSGDFSVFTCATAHFTASASDDCGGALTYTWNFGDGGTATGTSVFHRFAAASPAGGTTVTLTVTSAYGSATQTRQETVQASAVTATAPHSSLSPALTCDTVVFSTTAQNSCGNADLRYQWNFGDGTTSTDAAPSHRFAAPSPAGGYTVTVTVTDAAFGGSDTKTFQQVVTLPTITVTAPHATPSPALTCNTVTFSAPAQSTCAGTLTYAWDFGDGSTSTLASPTHRYAAASPAAGYTVTVTITDAYGGSATKTFQEVVTLPVITIASITPVPSPGATCSPVAFTASATGQCPGLLYAWDFGDGAHTDPAASAAASHQYGTPGDYTVTLTVTDPYGGSATQTKALHIDPPILTLSTLTSFKNPGTNCRPIQFTALATENCAATLTYTWDFGDGSPQVSGPQSVVSHQYAAPSPDEGYAVSLTVTDPARGLSATKTLLQAVTLPTITAGILAGPNPVLACGGPVQFTGNASEDCPGTLTYHWDFGDGGTSVAPAPAHQYVTASPAGGYTVTLTVTDAYGATKVVTYQETVTAPTITVQYDSVYPSQPTTCDTVSFSASASDQCPDGQLTYVWDFGDGSAPVTLGPGSSNSYYGGYTQHRYGTPSPVGGYTATLTVTDNYGGRTVKTYTVTVVAPTITVSGPSASPSPAKTCDTVSFSAYGSENCSDYSYGNGNGGNLTYTWDFGDGTAPVTPTDGYYAGYISHQFAAEGTYTVQVTVADDYHHAAPVTQTLSMTVTKPTITLGDITPSPDPSTTCSGPVSFSASVSEDCGGSYSYYGGGSSGGTLTYSWDFGDGSDPSTGNGYGSYGGYASHTFAEDGTYTVTLTVTDTTYGVTATKTATVTVNKPALVVDPPSAYPNPANVGDSVTFYGSAHDDCGGGYYGYGGAGPLTYSWDFGDGSPAVTGEGYGYAQHAYGAAKTYTATMTVTDIYGSRASKSLQVVVNGSGPPAGDFSLAADPSNLSMNATDSAPVNVTVVPSGGFAGMVDLSLVSPPAGIAGQFYAPSTQSGSTLVLTTSGAALGTYPLTVQGASGGVTRQTTVTVTVTGGPDFNLKADPDAVSATQGSGTSTSVFVLPLNGFTGSVALSVTGAPTGVTTSFVPASVPAGQAATLNISVGPAVPLGSYKLTVQGAADGKTRETTVTLTVTDSGFEVTADPSSLAVPLGKDGGTTVTVTPLGSFTGGVSLTLLGDLGDFTFDPTPVQVSGGQGGTSRLTIRTGGASLGDHYLTVQGTSGDATQKAPLKVTVVDPNAAGFTMKAIPSRLSLDGGDLGMTKILVRPFNGFIGTVALSLSGLPEGIVGSFQTTSLSINGPVGGVSVLQLSVGSSVKTGTYHLTVTGRVGTTVQTATVILKVGDGSQRVAKIQYRMNEGQTWTDVPQQGEPDYPLTVRQGDTVNFKAIRRRVDLSWPGGKPVWRNEASGIGETNSVLFEKQSTNNDDLKVVTAECMNSVSVYIKVDKGYKLSLDAATNPIMAGAGNWDAAKTELTATLTDYDGNSVANASISWSSVLASTPSISAGTFNVSTSTTIADGTSIATFTSGRMIGSAKITATAVDPNGESLTFAPIDIAMGSTSAGVVVDDYDWKEVPGLVNTQAANYTVTVTFGDGYVTIPHRQIDLMVTKVINIDTDGIAHDVDHPELYASFPPASRSTDETGIFQTSLLWHPPSSAAPGIYYIYTEVDDLSIDN